MNAPHDNALPASSYGFHCVLQPQTFAQGVALVTEALVTDGFGRRLNDAASTGSWTFEGFR